MAVDVSVSLLSEKAPADVVEHRLAACAACPHRSDAPRTVTYSIAAVLLRPRDRWICKLCGCFLARKAAYAEAECPATIGTDPSITRWQLPAPTAHKEGTPVNPVGPDENVGELAPQS